MHAFASSKRRSGPPGEGSSGSGPPGSLPPRGPAPSARPLGWPGARRVRRGAFLLTVVSSTDARLRRGPRADRWHSAPISRPWPSSSRSRRRGSSRGRRELPRVPGRRGVLRSSLPRAGRRRRAPAGDDDRASPLGALAAVRRARGPELRVRRPARPAPRAGDGRHGQRWPIRSMAPPRAGCSRRRARDRRGTRLRRRGVLPAATCRRGWSRAGGRWPAIVVASAAFGLIHLDPVQGSVAFAAGLFQGWVVDRFGGQRPRRSWRIVTNNVIFVAIATFATSLRRPRRAAKSRCWRPAAPRAAEPSCCFAPPAPCGPWGPRPAERTRAPCGAVDRPRFGRGTLVAIMPSPELVAAVKTIVASARAQAISMPRTEAIGALFSGAAFVSFDSHEKRQALRLMIHA